MMPAEQKALSGRWVFPDRFKRICDEAVDPDESHARAVDQVYKKLTPSVPLLGDGGCEERLQ